MVVVIIIVALLLLVGLIYILVRNSIISARNRCEEAWSGIDVQLKRRHDLVPNLVEAVKGYAAHERETLHNVTVARLAAVEAGEPAAVERAEARLTSALGGIDALAEAYPQLQASDSLDRKSTRL